jgi:citrate lyase subunit beta/citryl-CoA lyase
MEWPVRSSIFIPAHKASWVQKIVQYRPGAVVLDLEDAVTPLEKAAARKGVPQLLKMLHDNGIGTIVRMNPLEERWCR